jgi:predicted DCC family thiol-disulfide oxidoreductase YuxK
VEDSVAVPAHPGPLGILRLVPARLRDPVYRLVARNRYRLFGKRDECWARLRATSR